MPSDFHVRQAATCTNLTLGFLSPAREQGRAPRPNGEQGWVYVDSRLEVDPSDGWCALLLHYEASRGQQGLPGKDGHVGVRDNEHS